MTLGTTYINWPQMEETRDFNYVKINFKDFQVFKRMSTKVFQLRDSSLITDKTSCYVIKRDSSARCVSFI